MESLIAVGRLTKPHGLRGELVFLPYVYDISLLPDLVQRQVFVRHGQMPIQAHTVSSWRPGPKRILVQLFGCEDITTAETWREYEVLIPRHWFPSLPTGQYYWFEIEGLGVYDTDGSYLGTVAEIIYTGSNDVYVVKKGGEERLIPALRNVIRTIDLEHSAIHLAIDSGLLN